MRRPKVQPLHVVPFSKDALRAALPTPTKPRETCTICSQIGPYGEYFAKSGEIEHNTLSPAVEQLRFFLRLGEHNEREWIAKCPECARLYHREEGYEYFVNGGEDTDSCYETTPEKILDMSEVRRAEVPGGELRHDDEGQWALYWPRTS